MDINTDQGKNLINGYLSGEKLDERRVHSLGVGDFAYKVAKRIIDQNPELRKQPKMSFGGKTVNPFDPEFIGFLGYTHDLGYARASGKHECHSIDILTEEGLEREDAEVVMHGQLFEQFGHEVEDKSIYLPCGIPGMILTYADMSVRLSEPVSMEERRDEILQRVRGLPIPEQVKVDIKTHMHNAFPRFERYRSVVFALAGVNSHREF